MKKMLRFFIAVGMAAVFSSAAPAASVSLDGNAYVNVTSDTANTAKNMAMSEARRQIITDVLEKHANVQQLTELMKQAKDSDLANLIASTSIDGEHLSATAYSANIKMSVDVAAAKKWLDNNEVQNWLGSDNNVPQDKSLVTVDVSRGLRDWIDLNRTLQADRINIEIKRISGSMVMVGIADTNRNAFLASIRNAGWRYSDTDGYLRIWKY